LACSLLEQAPEILDRALAAMSRQSMPSSVAYDEAFTPRGLGLRVLNVRNTAVVHIVYSSDATARLFHRTQSDGENAAGMVDVASGKRYTAARPFWSATWLPLQGSNATPADFKNNSVASVTGDVILDFGRVGNYWLVTFGQVDATVRAFFRTVSGAAFFSASRFVIPSPSR
jgi:hypothetical protein